MATLAAAFARYFAQLRTAAGGDRRGEVWQAGAAVLAIAVVTTVNVLGTRARRHASGPGDSLEGRRRRRADGPAISPRTRVGWPTCRRSGPKPLDGSIFTGMMAAMVGVLWAYDGWTNVTPLAEEIRDPGRNIPRSLLMGMAVLIAVYWG